MRLAAVRNKRAKVVFDDGSPFGDIRSYRGDYSELSVEPHLDADAPDRSRKSESPTGMPYAIFSVRTGRTQTVAQVERAIDLAIGSTFYGYKGGEFYMSGDETLHVAGYGDTSDTYITGVRLDGNRVVLDTTIDEDVFY